MKEISFPNLISVDDKLSLRTFKSEDAESVFNLIEINRNFLEKYNKVPQSLDDVNQMIKMDTLRINERSALSLGIWYNNEYVGMIATKPIKWKHGRVEIGYYLGENFTRQGIAQKSLNAFINFFFEELNFNRIEATTNIENIASARLLEKLGFTKEGILRETSQLHGKWIDEAVYSLLRRDRRF